MKIYNMDKIKILLVEDNEGDILLTREAFEEAKIMIDLDVVRDGKLAIDYLSNGMHNENVEFPDLILLDVNLPKKNGHEVLQFIKTDVQLKHIPVIMLTTSSSPKDINLSYNNHVNCFITKPVDAGTFLEVVSSIENFWIKIVKLPNTKKNYD